MRYALLIHLLAPLFFAHMWWRGRREPAWREGWDQRLGRLPVRRDRPLWIHLASMGEANSAAPLLEELRRRWPELPLQLTAFTPTGLARLRELVPDATASLLPLDLPWAVRRAEEAIRPRALVILETELWPNLLDCCGRDNVPVIWLSGRLREASEVWLRRLFSAGRLRRSLGGVRAFGVQTERDASRFIRLGAPPAHVHVTGSLKYDMAVPESVAVLGRKLHAGWGRPLVWLAASTHPGEEDMALQAHRALLRHQPDALLLLAPRHPRRADDVSALVRKAELSLVRHSQREELGAAQVLLIDTLGDLPLFYAACDLCLVAGSLMPVGGHNLLEPAVLARPILAGPHLDSCRDMADELIRCRGLTVVEDVAALTAAVLDYARTPEPWIERGQAAASFAAASRGALGRSMALLEPVL